MKEIQADDVNFWKVANKFIAAVWDAHATVRHEDFKPTSILIPFTL